MLFTYPSPLLPGKLVARYKRFFADVQLATGETVTAHCPNTGTMRTCGSAGDRVFLLHEPSPKRKLHYTWELTETGGGYVGVNTMRPNQIVARAVAAGAIPELAGYGSARPEVKYGANSRIDLLLEAAGRPACYVEVKNTTLLDGDRVVFPDAVTSRGLKHLQELQAVAASGQRAVMLFFVNRPEGRAFAPAAEVDPVYARALLAARDAGVEVLAYRARHTLAGTTIDSAVALEF